MVERLEHFRLTITGDKIAPESLSLHDLTDLLHLYQSLLQALAAEQGFQHPKKLTLRLTGIHPGSVVADLCAPERAAKPALDRLAARRNGTPFSSPSAERRYRSLRHLLAKRRWSLETDHAAIPPITITAAEESNLITGLTTVYGLCLHVGGERPTARIRPDGQKETARVLLTTRDQAKTVAAALYGTIGVTGKATWDATTGNVRKIEADTIIVLHDAPPGEAIDALRRTAGPGWDAIDDPEQFLREVRCE